MYCNSQRSHAGMCVWGVVLPPAAPRACSHCRLLCSFAFWHGMRNAESSTVRAAQNRGTRKSALRRALFVLLLFSSASVPWTATPVPPRGPGPPPSSPALSRPECLWPQYCLPFPGCLSLHSSSSSSSSGASPLAPTCLPDLLPRSFEEPEPGRLSLPRPFLG